MANDTRLDLGSGGDLIKTFDDGTRKTQVVFEDGGMMEAAGDVTGRTVIHKFGSQAAISTTEYPIWDVLGAYTYGTTAPEMQIRSLDANDTAAGTGARKVMIVGLDNSWADQTFEATLNGTTPVITTGVNWRRVFRLYVTETGTYGGANVGIIACAVSGGSPNQASIVAGAGQSAMAMYTVPAGKTAYLRTINFYCPKTGGGTNDITVRLKTRAAADTVAAPFSAFRTQFVATTDAPGFSKVYPAPLVIAEKTDIQLTAVAAAGSHRIAGDFELTLVDN